MKAVPERREPSDKLATIQTACLPWPINEILLHALILRRRSDAQIAQMHGVHREDVAALRESYGL